jgi:hypothetical protein
MWKTFKEQPGGRAFWRGLSYADAASVTKV